MARVLVADRGKRRELQGMLSKDFVFYLASR
jgi:hypothetical protein